MNRLFGAASFRNWKGSPVRWPLGDSTKQGPEGPIRGSIVSDKEEDNVFSWN